MSNIPLFYSPQYGINPQIHIYKISIFPNQNRSIQKILFYLVKSKTFLVTLQL